MFGQLSTVAFDGSSGTWESCHCNRRAQGSGRQGNEPAEGSHRGPWQIPSRLRNNPRMPKRYRRRRTIPSCFAMIHTHFFGTIRPDLLVSKSRSSSLWTSAFSTGFLLLKVLEPVKNGHEPKRHPRSTKAAGSHWFSKSHRVSPPTKQRATTLTRVPRAAPRNGYGHFMR